VKSPVFIVGSGGSGTTLLRLMLNAHPHLAIPPESDFIPEVWKAFWRSVPYTRQRLGEILRFLETFPGYRNFQLDRGLVEERLLALCRPTLSEVLGAVYTEYAERHGKSRWGDKTPGYVEQLKRLNALFPDCLVIHLIRDGRDAALSMLSRGVGPRTLYDAAKEWEGRVKRGRRDGPRVLGASRYLEVHYERLVAEPRATLEHICGFIDEPMDERMLEFYHDAPAHIPPARRQRHVRTSGPVTTDRVRRWERELRLWDILTVQAVGGKWLAACGYPLKRSPLAWLVTPAVRGRRIAESAMRIPRKLARSLAKRLQQFRAVADDA